MFSPPSEVVQCCVHDDPEYVLKYLDDFYTVLIDGHYLYFDTSGIIRRDDCDMPDLVLCVFRPGWPDELLYECELDDVGHVLEGISADYFDPRYLLGAA